MDILSEVFQNLIALDVLIALLLGSFVGLIVGVLPGLGAVVAVVLLLPVTLLMDPISGVLLLVAAYTAAEYGGSVSSILLGIPGTPAAVPTLLDGFPLGRKHGTKLPVSLALYASTSGGLIGTIVLVAIAVPLAQFALRFSDPEFFLIALLGLVAVAALAGSHPERSTIGVLIGLMLSTIGMDGSTGVARYTFGIAELDAGIAMVVLVVALFALTEVFSMAKRNQTGGREQQSKGLVGSFIKPLGFFKYWRQVGLGGAIGSTAGIFPGMGAGPAAWFSYAGAKAISKDPDSFGSGNPEGVVAPETANNGAVGGAFVPVLAFGIPGSASMAIVMGALIVNGITPGPRMMQNDPGMVYTIFIGFGLSVIAMFVLGRFLTPLMAYVVRVPMHYLVPTILATCITGVLAATTMGFSLIVMLVIGVLAYVLKVYGFGLPQIVLGFVLGPILESSLRTSLALSGGDWSIFVTRPFSLGIILVSVAIGGIYVYVRRKTRKSVDVTKV